MLESQLRQQLSIVARRIGQLWMWRRLTWSWIGLSVLVVGWVVAGRPIVVPSLWFAVAGSVGAAVWLRSRMLSTSKTVVARQIEQAFPDLKSRLLAALEQSPDIETGRMNVLQRQVISEAMHHARMNDWCDAIPPKQMTRAFLSQTAALALFVIVGIVAMQASSNSASALSKRHSAPSVLTSDLPVTVEPGSAELERGTSLLILARFSGKPPADVQVVWKGVDRLEHRMSLTKSLDDPVFATRLPAIKEDISYRIEFDGRQTVDYQITVYDLPALIRSDLELEFPSYTGLARKPLEDAFEATVVEGTRVAISCKVNKPLASARLVGTDQSVFEMSPDANSSTFHFQFVPTKRMRMNLELVDESGRKNRDPEEYRIDVVPNRIPDLKLVFPGKDVKASPLEEVVIEATTIDDFGILDTGLVIQVAGRDPVTVSLGKDLEGVKPHKLSSVQRLEDLRVQPDELVTYYLYAVDFGPDGLPRQTNSDVFFVEVRSFDEIFRQVDQQGEGEMQSSQKPPDSLAKLLELQKQVIVASWKQARAITPTWTAKTAEDTETIFVSQTQAIKKLHALRERMSQPQLQPIFSTIADAMEKAQQELARSADTKSFAPLKPAVVAEQSAYQGLLKLRAKEHLLIQAKSKGNGQENEEKEKLDLELKRKDNRYESEKSAAKKDDSNVNREALAILDRLKELANRQDGINQQLKELEAQMRQAKTDADKEEIERRLKRLREEQQQLLHDSDELRNKLNKMAQPETVAETKQQLEKTRQHLAETAEKIREGQLSQALNAGTRAERELKQLHEDFRKQTAAQFADAMRSLRDEARQLADREKQLGEQLDHLGDDTPRRSLRQSQERSQLEAEFQQQRRQTNEIVEKAKQVVEQAETSEPLLSKQLYDTLRSTRESKLDQALNATQQLLKQGIIPEAAKAEQQARTGIEQLKQGIERAAESVLGNEVDSLKRAKRELALLSEQLEQEIQGQGGQKQANEAGDGTQKASGKDSQGQEGQGKEGTGKDGQGQKGKQPGDGKAEGSGESSGKEPGAPGKGTDGGSNPTGQKDPAGQGTSGAGDGQGETPSGEAGDQPGSGDASRGSDASVPASTNSKDGTQPSGPPARSGLRTPKPGGKSSPAPGRKELAEENGEGGGSPGNSQGGGPLTGSNFTEFNDRLRDVESMIGDPQIQAEVQKVRDRARSARAEFKRHTQTPNWDLVRSSVHQPMIELQQRLADEIAKRESPDSLVPVDRDPVPTRYKDLVRSYYERLGSGKSE